ncbi:MAG: MopE-related protein [Bacteroidota bacterium]
MNYPAYTHCLLWCLLSALSIPITAQSSIPLTNPSACPLHLPLSDNNCPENSNFYNPDVFAVQVVGAPGTQLGVDVYLQSVRLLVEHPWVSDLNFALRSPGGVTAQLLGNVGGNGDNFGDTSLVACSGALELELAACTSIAAGVAPFVAGPYRALDDFYLFNDSITNPNGNWELLICDDLADDVGILQYVELVFAPLSCLPVQELVVLAQDSTEVTFAYEPTDICGPAIIEVGPPGFTPGTHATPGIGGTIFTVNCPPSTISGLAEDTAYDAYLRRSCPLNGSYSSNSCVVSFRTGCNPGPVTARTHFDNEVNCAPVCTFDCDLTGDWRNIATDELDWIVYSGSTPTTFGTGPDDDITGGGKYVYLEANGFQCPAGSEAILHSACVVLDKMGRDSCHFSFNYHMKGTQVGSLRVEASDDGGQNWQTVWQRSGQQGLDWRKAYVSLGSFANGANLQLRLIGVKGNGIFGDLAVDELRFHGSTVLGYPTNRLYTDADNDGFGALTPGTLTCLAAPPPGFVFNNQDCDDTRSTVYPGAPEIACNGIDENCNAALTDDDVILPPPVTGSDTICSGDLATLTAVAPPGFQLFWYEDINRSTGIIGVGSPFQPVIAANTTPFDRLDTFFVEVTNFVCSNPVLGQATVLSRPRPDGQIVGVPAICPGDSLDLGSLNIQDTRFTGGQLTFHRSLPPNVGNQINTAVFPTPDSTYFYQIESPFGCTDVDSFQIADRAVPSISFLPADSFSLCRSLHDTLFASATGGVGSYSFNWFDGRTSTFAPIQASMTPGDLTAYQLSVTDSLGCTGVDSALVMTTNSIDSLRFFTQDVSTCNGSDGEIIVVPLNGLAPFSYVWENEAGSTGSGSGVLDTIRLTGLSQNAYRITLTDNSAEGCEVSLRNLRIQGPGFQVGDATITPPSCHDTSDGEICLDVTGGTGVISYLWSDSQTSACASNLAAGNYSVTISNGGCTTVEAFDLEGPEALALVWSPVPPTCSNLADGSLSANVFGGLSPYGYDWGGGNISPSITNLTPGLYPLTITDAGGCTLSDNFLLSGPPPLSVVIDDRRDISCAGEEDGILQVTGTGGTLPYQYNWDNGTNSPLQTNLAAGSYPVTVTDFNQCTTVGSFGITAPTPLALSLMDTLSPVCRGDSTGEITLSLVGGNGPYSYEWNDGFVGNSPVRSQLPVGDYTVYARDANNCISDTISINLLPQSDLLLNLTITDPTCVGLTDGAISVAASGQAPQSYQWGDSFLGANRNGLPVGTYALTVTDGRGCVADTLIEVTAPQVFDIQSTVSPPSCFGIDDGIIDQTLLQQGQPPFQFFWPDGTQHVDQLFLGPGDYQYTVTDAIGCTFISDTFQLAYPDPLVLNVIDRGELACAGDANAYLETAAAGGTSPYSYNWVGANNMTSSIFQLPAGDHRLIVTDARGCVVDTIFQFQDPPALQVTASLSPGNVCDPNDPDLLVSNVTGGQAPYAYQWTDGSTNPTLVDPLPGDYFLTVTDAAGCSRVFGTVKVQERIAPLVLDSFVVDQVSCFGGSDAVMTAYTSGGSDELRYHFTPTYIEETDTNFLQVSGITYDLNYSLTVTDLKTDCEVESSIINGQQPPQITIQRDSFDVVNCFGGADGAIYVSVQGGTGAYTYDWQDALGNPVGNQEDLLFITEGRYELLVTDANGCQANYLDSNVVSVNSLIALMDSSITNVLCRNATTGAIDVSIQGGRAPYTYQWSSGPQTQDLVNLAAGVYDLTVTDADTCVAIFTGFPVTEPATSISLTATIDFLD